MSKKHRYYDHSFPDEESKCEDKLGLTPTQPNAQ